MALWSKKAGSAVSRNPGKHNPYRSLDPNLFDQGEKINREAARLRHAAAMELTGSDVIIALANAVGGEVAASALARTEGSLPSERQHVLDQILGKVCLAVREAAHIAAGASYKLAEDQERKLTSEEFDDLVGRLVFVATADKIPSNDALAAVAKTLGSMIAVLAQRPGVSGEDLITLMQETVAEFARDATKQLRHG